jgi:2-polyprenyl-3-methyl-5-hydroxy-6-metoxy-1,4-benzoquinol methylase
VKDHWDQAWSDHDAVPIDTTFPYADLNETNRFFGQRIHELPKQKVLEIGCGEGAIATHLAKRGADVTAIDVSAEAVEATRRNAAHNGVETRVDARQMDALDIDVLPGNFDFVVGRFVLHHIEPFGTFVELLDAVTTSSARGVFLENSARNRLLMLFRDHLAGRLGVPKYGDDHEQPLTQAEIDSLRSDFDVEVHHPELVFLKKMNTYLIGYENGLEYLVELVKSLDDTLYQIAPPLRKYSYLQVIELDKSAG